MAKKPRKRFDTLGNLDMIKNSVTAIKHHADELTAELKKNPEIEAWVLSKVDRAAQNLSDVTHYLDGEMNKFADGGMMAETESITVAMEGEADEIKKIKSYFKSNFNYDFNDENISDYGTELYFYNVDNLKVAEFVKRWVNENYNNVAVSINYVGGGTMADGGMMAKGGTIKLGDIVEVKEPNYGYNDSYYVVSNKAGYDKKSFLISPTRSTLSDVFDSYQLKKIMADGGKVGDSGTVQAANYNQYTGIIKEIRKSNLSVNLGNGIKGTESEMYATVIDENGKERFGILI
jgi:hypothetical protein